MTNKNFQELNNKTKRLKPIDMNRSLHQIENIHSFQVHIFLNDYIYITKERSTTSMNQLLYKICSLPRIKNIRIQE